MIYDPNAEYLVTEPLIVNAIATLQAERDELRQWNTELLAALETLVRECELVGLLDSPQLADARAAIAKVKQ